MLVKSSLSKYILSFVFLISFYGNFKATHIMGGDFKISMINHNAAGGEYIIQLRLFRDDANAAVDLPQMVTIGIYELGSHSRYTNVDLNLSNGTGNIIPLGDSCYTPDPTLFNIQEGFYFSSSSVQLPNYSSGYYLHYETCCRTNALSNLANPGSVGISIIAIIPDPAIGFNSSPDFGIYPLDAYFCTNSTNKFSWPVTDPDGDSLVFSLATPLNWDGTSPNIGHSAPGSGSYPYYPYCSYAPGYNQNNMIGGNPSMSINPSTGEITCNPSSLGFFVFTVLVEEYRNGIKIGEVRRDAQFKSEICNLSPPPSLFANLQPSFGADTFFLDVNIGDSSCIDLEIGTASSIAGCQHSFEMYDSYGDGWNGGSVDVLVNGTNVLTGASFNSGSSSSLPFMARDGDSIELANWVPGTYPNEISWIVTNDLGVVGAGSYLTTSVGNGSCGLDSTFTKLISDIDLVRGYIEPNNHIHGLFNTSLAYYDWCGTGVTAHFNPYVFKNGYIGTKGNIYLRYCWEDLCNGTDSALSILTDSYSIDCSGINPRIQNIIINCVTGSNLQFPEKRSSLIYPNPTKGEIIISVNNFNGNIKSELFDLMGNKIFSTNKKIMNLKNYAKGIYIIKVEFGNKIEEFKVFKE